MDITNQDEEDRLMESRDVIELIRDYKHSNETPDGLDDVYDETNQEETNFFLPPYISSTVVLLILLVALILFLFINIFRYKKKLNRKFHLKRFTSPYETSISSSSGSGLGRIRRRTIGDQIEFLTKIEVGSFGRVWVINYRGQAYACRVYNTLEQDLWSHEVNILSQLKKGVTGMFANDVKNDPITSATRFLVITDYYPNGSLYHFLRTQRVNEEKMVHFIRSISDGIHYLHTIMLGNPRKLAVVHFNLKSKNIMVAHCGFRCLISDFSKSCTYSTDAKISETPKFDCDSDSLRYRAPELFSTNQVPKDVNEARACDIYSFALIMWEIASSCILRGSHEPINGHYHQLPYEEELQNQKPSHQNMYQLVNLNKVRPKINNKWSTSMICSKIAKIINQSWTSSPPSRLTAGRIMKDLDILAESILSKDEKKQLISVEIA